MAKVIIPEQENAHIQVQGVGKLHPVDQQLVVEILSRMESALRRHPATASLQEVAARFFGDSELHADAAMLLQLADEAGEPLLGSTIEAQRLTMH